MADRVMLVAAAEDDGSGNGGNGSGNGGGGNGGGNGNGGGAPRRLVAGALNLIGSHALYGRNWGCLPGREYKHLHFELCYYQVSCTAGLLLLLSAGCCCPECLLHIYRLRCAAVLRAAMPCVPLPHVPLPCRNALLAQHAQNAQALEEAIARKLPRVEAGAQGEHKLQRGYLPSLTYSSHYLRAPELRRAVESFLIRERSQMEGTVAQLTLQVRVTLFDGAVV